MNHWLHTLVNIEIGAELGILILCGIILMRGGLYPIHIVHQGPTRLQRIMGRGLLLNVLVFIPAVINDVLQENFQLWLSGLFSYLSIVVYGFISLFALVLRQRPVRLRELLLIYLPTVPMLLTVPFCGEHRMVFVIMSAIAYIYLTIMTLYAIYKLKHWDDIMMGFYSDVVHKQTKWFRNLMQPFLAMTFLWIPMFFWPEQKWLDLFYYGLSIFIFIRFTECALSQEEFTVDKNLEIEMEIQERGDEEPAADDTPTIPEWADKLDELMLTEHLYRKEDLTRNDLADKLCINRTYISRYLNDVQHLTFYEYINNFRLDESEQLLREGKLSITEIAYRCGFRDRIAFYRYFSKRHGKSPSEWQRQEAQDS